jgi:soluble lytic murein transglycosylase
MRRIDPRIRAVIAAGVLVAAALLAVVFSRTRDDGLVRAEMAGDVDEMIGGIRTADMPAQAQAFLATDRPWRAARVMRAYSQRVRDMRPEHRVLAARAEGGWGGWPAVRELLEGVRALDTYDDGVGLYLLGRARDEAGDAAGAVAAYRSFLALSAPAGRLEAERAAAQLRLALALVRTGDRAAGQRELQIAAARAGGAATWLELLFAGSLAQLGDTAAVREAVAPFNSGLPGLHAWRARILAARAAGDHRQARTIANSARAWAGTRGTRAEFLLESARSALDIGDTAAGRAALRGVIADDVAGPYARRAAELLAAGRMTPADHLAVARVNRAQGLHEESIEGYRQWLQSGVGSAEERAGVVMEHANALFYAARYDDVAAALRPIASRSSARSLQARAEAHRGNTAEAARIYLSIATQYPRTGTGAQALYLAASTWHDDNDEQRAAPLYRRVLAEYPASSQAALSMMRLAGMAFLNGDFAGAARLWDQYRTRSPRGEYALQATYWSGRARLEMGDSTAARALFSSVRQRARDSYYALLASRHIAESFWPLPVGAPPADDPAAAQRVAALLRGLDMLRAAGFPDEASAEVDRVAAAAGGDAATRYGLAEALAERGYSQRAIRIGLGLQGSGASNRRLLRILYPFPYRTLVSEEARARGIDPYMVAALIRQESMFESRVTSPAGARGLMQIMPATGRRLADASGLESWDAELLYHPEIAVHLGTRYLAQHSENYDGSLPSVFAAYNAGGHRVEWWRRWPEHRHDDLFAERIPFAETRGYVKILTRNHAIYRGLYGADD